MEKCKTVCRLCDRLVISDSVTVVGTDLVVDIPAASYGNCSRYCIVIAQVIPDAATINMPVSVSVGGDTGTLYPLTDKCGTQLTASEIRTRTRYSVIVHTTADGGSFRILGKICSRTDNALGAIPAVTAGGAA